MSAKNSFDIQRKSKPAAPAKRPAAKAAKKAAARPAKKRSAPRAPKSLRRKREEAQSVKNVLLGALVLGILGGVVYGFWRPEVRITSVTASGLPDTALVSALVKKTVAGTYFGVFPRDSIFLYPEQAVRKAVLEANPSIITLSVSRDSFHSLKLTAAPRHTAFFWCGVEAVPLASSTESCYDADVRGFIFAHASDDTGTSTLLHIFGPIETASSSSVYPLKGSVTGAAHLSSLLDFITFVKSKNIPVLYTRIEGDEATLYVSSKTSIRYVLGQEKHAEELATAAFPTLSLLDNSIQYADLRFQGRVYVKRYGAEVK